MQERYAGDIADFSKRLLLEALSEEPDFSDAGIFWYLNPDEPNVGHGNVLGYLADPRLAFKYRAQLEIFRQAVGGPRGLSALDRAGAWLAAGQYRQMLDLLPVLPTRRQAYRKQWFEHGISELTGKRLILADPDNGMLPKGLSETAVKASKYALPTEVTALCQTFDCVIVYQHYGRKGSHLEQMWRWREDHRARVPGHQVEVVRWGLSSPRAYVVLSQSGVPGLAQRLDRELWSVLP